MTYELIQFGLFKGLPALHMDWSQREGRTSLTKKIQDFEEKFKMPASKQYVLIDTRDISETVLLDTEELMLTIGLLRDMNYKVIVWVDAAQINTALRVANTVEVWLKRGQEWAQHLPSSIIIVPDAQRASPPSNMPVYIGKHLENVAKFVAWEDIGYIPDDVVLFLSWLQFPALLQQVTASMSVRI
jgi:hypothetical protein